MSNDKYLNLTNEEIKKVYSYNYCNEKVIERYLKLLNNCNSRQKTLILEYLKPLNQYLDSKYSEYIKKFKDSFLKNIDIFEYAISINEYSIINKLYYIKRVIVENPIINKRLINKIYNYYNKYCKTLLIDDNNVNNDSIRDYILEMICSIQINDNMNVMKIINAL